MFGTAFAEEITLKTVMPGPIAAGAYTPTEITAYAGPMNYVEAVQYCKNLGGGWHMPTVDEAALFLGQGDNRWIWTHSHLGTTLPGMMRIIRLSDGNSDLGSLNDSTGVWVRAVR